MIRKSTQQSFAAIASLLLTQHYCVLGDVVPHDKYDDVGANRKCLSAGTRTPNKYG